MDNGLEKLRNQLLKKVKVLDERIERRDRPCFFDESEKIKELHSEAFVYEQVIKMIDEINIK